MADVGGCAGVELNSIVTVQGYCKTEWLQALHYLLAIAILCKGTMKLPVLHTEVGQLSESWPHILESIKGTCRLIFKMGRGDEQKTPNHSIRR